MKNSSKPMTLKNQFKIFVVYTWKNNFKIDNGNINFFYLKYHFKKDELNI